MVLGLPLVGLMLWWHLTKRTQAVRMLSATHLIAGRQQELSFFTRWWPVMVRGTICVLLVMATARPRLADERTKKHTQGIATLLVLDVSGSMSCFDDPALKKSRFTVAQEEAIRFIKKRTDLFGLIIFGASAATRCPLTSDKELLIKLIEDMELGILNPQGTALSLAIALGVNRLKTTDAPSKIMVVLTDGEPSEHDIDPAIALQLAQSAGIKIYTIGIGGCHGYIDHPLAGIVPVASPLNEQLLRHFAHKTGGAFFKASNQQELQEIYTKIDTLEKSSHEEPQYGKYYELGMVFLFCASLLLLFDLLMSMGWWVRL